MTTLAAHLACAAEPAEMPLWPSGAPGTQGLTNNETSKDGIVFNTFQPTLRVFLPPADRATGTALIICPGGGYNVLEMVREGETFAKRLNEFGIAGFVLKYRLRNRAKPDDTSYLDNALADAQRALRLVRANADRWHVRPDRIGIGGFSAGGHLSANAGTHGIAGTPAAPDPLDRVSSRPDFLVLIYPAARMFGANATADTPPSFLVHGGNDTIVPPGDSLTFYTALQAAGVPAELHIFDGEPHGFDIGKPGAPAAAWPDLLRAWLRARRLL